MGTYASASDISKYYNNKEFGSDTAVTDTEVEAFITIQEAYVDAILRPLYVLPLTESEDVSTIKKIVEYLVTCDLDGVFREGQDTESKSFNYKRNLCKVAEKALEMIASKKLKLKGAKVDTSPAFFNSVGSNGEIVEPFFTDAKANPDNWDSDADSSICSRCTLEN